MGTTDCLVSPELRVFDVINTMKSYMESECAGIMSCANILAVAARDSIVKLGGPY